MLFIAIGIISDRNIPTLTDFLTIKLGKTIVKCNDTPGFIANRIGCFLLELIVRTAITNKLNRYSAPNC
jgi:3-hydroxyacyl-CoA dehydrogenase/enoyl-CoA hydratase/3-hydroxybutyryl-CoA epimerase